MEFKKLSLELEEVLMEKTKTIVGGNSDGGGIDWQAFYDSHPEGEYKVVTDDGGTYIVDDNGGDLYTSEGGITYFLASFNGVDWIQQQYEGSDFSQNSSTMGLQDTFADIDFISFTGVFGLSEEWEGDFENVMNEIAETMNAIPVLKTFNLAQDILDLYNIITETTPEETKGEFAWKLIKWAASTYNAWVGVGVHGAQDLIIMLGEGFQYHSEQVGKFLRDIMDPMNPDAIHTPIPQEVRDDWEQKHPW